MKILKTIFRACSRELHAQTYVKDRKVLQDGSELFIKRVLGELDLSHVKVSYPTDLEVFMDDLRTKMDRQPPPRRIFSVLWVAHRRRLALRPRQDDIQKISGGWHWGNRLDAFCGHFLVVVWVETVEGVAQP